VKKEKDLSFEDKEVWEEFKKNTPDIYDKEENRFLNNHKNKRFKFDLHGFTLDQANVKVKEIILSCVERNYKEILFITGKGLHSTNKKNIYVSQDLGKLKFSVPEFIKSDNDLNKLIISISDANTKDGGGGAMLVKLKNL
tara:strand:+ start:430 stop:849 length:420 start_codon:yes stop_codon:yes gene_type:complete